MLKEPLLRAPDASIVYMPEFAIGWKSSADIARDTAACVLCVFACVYGRQVSDKDKHARLFQRVHACQCICSIPFHCYHMLKLRYNLGYCKYNCDTTWASCPSCTFHRACTHMHNKCVCVWGEIWTNLTEV